MHTMAWILFVSTKYCSIALQQTYLTSKFKKIPCWTFYLAVFAYFSLNTWNLPLYALIHALWCGYFYKKNYTMVYSFNKNQLVSKQPRFAIIIAKIQSCLLSCVSKNSSAARAQLDIFFWNLDQILKYRWENWYLLTKMKQEDIHLHNNCMVT